MQVIRLVMNLIMILIVTHNTACFFYYSALNDGFDPETWVFRKDQMSDDISNIYLTAFYYSVEQLTTVVYGDVLPETSAEVTINIIWTGIGLAFFSYVISTMTSLLTSRGTTEARLEYQIKEFEIIANDRCLPFNVMQQMKQKMYSQAKNTTLDTKRTHRLLKNLSMQDKYLIATSIH